MVRHEPEHRSRPTVVTAGYNANHTAAQLTVQLNDSLPATVQLDLSNASGSQSASISTPVINGAYTFARTSPVNQAYTLSVAALSRPGSNASPGSPSASFGTSGSTPAQSASASCSFTLPSAVPVVTISNATGAPYTNLNASTINVTWNSSADSLGFFTYHEVGSSENWTVSDIAPVRASNGNWVYSLEVHGLEPMVAYNGTLGVSWGAGCLVVEDQIVEQDFKTPNDPSFLTDATLPHVWAASLPYDPINESGGGLEVGWDNPTTPARAAGALTLLNGTVSVASGTYRTTIRFNASMAATVPHPSNGTDGAYVLNVTNLSSAYRGWTLDHAYMVTVSANYTYLKQTKTGLVPTLDLAQGHTTGFVYERATAAGGLPDSVKAVGWTAIENGTPVRVYPVTNRDATNGLVSDYAEMEYSLNPNSVDTSSSHMLDAWNLTFLVGPEWTKTTAELLANLSTYFEFYNETVNYTFPNVTTANQNRADLVCTSTGTTCARKHWVGDSNSSASGVLWSSKLLMTLSHPKWVPGTFATLAKSEDDGWLRATLGTYNGSGTYHGYLILTVWGKMSWGANPWETSTSGDGLADGNQPDPLGPVILQVNLTYWGVNNSPGANAEVEPLINISGGGQQLYSGWGPIEFQGMQSCDNGPDANCSLAWSEGDWAPSYASIVSVPVVSTTQFAQWHVDMVTASATGALITIANTSTRSVDLENIDHTVNVSHAAVWYWVANHPTEQDSEGHVSLNYTVLPPVPKANTLLLTPPNQPTLAPDPLGHLQYVGEPDFDLLVLNLTNASDPLTLSGIPNPNGGSDYSLALEPGLNNILVPRGAFIDSPLSGALLNNSSTTVGPVGGLTFVPEIWGAEAEQPAGSNLSGPNVVRIFAPANQSESNSSYFEGHSGAFSSGAGYSTLEQGVESRALQSVAWINITNTSGLGNRSAELASLIAGLLLNSSGNLSFQLVNVTADIPWLMLPPTVIGDLAGRDLLNSGDHGPPVYDAQGSSGYSGGAVYLELWNAVVDAGKFLVQVAFETLRWLGSADEASQQYVAGAVAGAITTTSVGLSRLANQTVATLKAVGSAMLWALEQLIDRVFEPLVRPLISAATAYTQSLASDLDPNPPRFWTDYSSAFMLGVVGLAVAWTLAFLIMEGACVGAPLIALLVAALLVAGASIYDSSHRSAFEGMNPYSPSVVGGLESFLPTSSTQVEQNLSDLATILGAVTTTWAVQDVEQSVTVGRALDEATAWGTSLGIVGLIIAGIAKASNSTADAAVSVLFDAGSVIADTVALSSPDPESYDQDVATLFLDAASTGIDPGVFLASV